MYPFIRFAKEILKFRNAPRIGVTDTHVSHHVCWPWDLDLWAELNNGRTLTLFDLGRVPLAYRNGLIGVLRANGWGITVAGSTIRYRRRIRAFARFEMRSRCVGWDARFIYIEQAMYLGEVCANHVLIRSAFTGKDGIVAPARLLEVMGTDPESPPLPDWVAAWCKADATRPWPPAI